MIFFFKSGTDDYTTNNSVGGSEFKASACNVGDLGLIPGSRRSPGEGNGNPLQYSCLENPMDGGAWWATVHRVAKSQTLLSDFTFMSCIIFSSRLKEKKPFYVTKTKECRGGEKVCPFLLLENSRPLSPP